MKLSNITQSKYVIIFALPFFDLRSLIFKSKMISGTFHTIDGHVFHVKNGLIHRDNGPAALYNFNKGRKEWYKNGEIHNEHGPAIVYPNGHEEYWLYDKPYAQGRWERLVGNKKKDFILILSYQNESYISHSTKIFFANKLLCNVSII